MSLRRVFCPWNSKNFRNFQGPNAPISTQILINTSRFRKKWLKITFLRYHVNELIGHMYFSHNLIFRNQLKWIFGLKFDIYYFGKIIPFIKKMLVVLEVSNGLWIWVEGELFKKRGLCLMKWPSKILPNLHILLEYKEPIFSQGVH